MARAPIILQLAYSPVKRSIVDHFTEHQQRRSIIRGVWVRRSRRWNWGINVVLERVGQAVDHQPFHGASIQAVDHGWCLGGSIMVLEVGR